MAGAAIPLEPETYDAAILRPMGRNAAGEGFLRAYLRYAEAERIYLWNIEGQAEETFAPLLQRLGPPAAPVTWLDPADRAGLAAPGAVHFPSPLLQRQAWARRPFGATSYSITGVTHTIAETFVLNEIASLLIGPMESWDALVCTSRAVRAAVEVQLEAVAGHLNERFGVTRIPPVQLVTIPLGVHTDDFAHDPAARAAWREAMGIPADALVALHFGRFSIGTKMNPAPMGLALQAAAKRVGKPVYWLLFGGARERDDEAKFRNAATAFCPDVTLRFAGDLEPDAHGSVWSAADVFVSFSDNVQESFGLTVLEAMAAGLPSVVSDWDGYRDTLRHGIDGFRIRTTWPRPGLGADLAYSYAQGHSNYEAYAAAAGQFTAVDIEAATEALAALFSDADLRRQMGAAARERARAEADWRVVMKAYHALWAELQRRRRAAPVQAPRGAGENPWQLDPFLQFQAHATQVLSHDDTAMLARPLTQADFAEVLSRDFVRTVASRLPSTAEVQALLAALSAEHPIPVGVLLARFPPDQRALLERALTWLAKFGLVRLSGNPPRA